MCRLGRADDNGIDIVACQECLDRHLSVDAELLRHRGGTHSASDGDHRPV